MKKKYILLLLIVPVLVGGLVLGLLGNPAPPQTGDLFDGARAFEDVRHQLSLGPRTPGSEGHAEVISWISGELTKSGWEVEIQNGEHLGFPVKNIIARRGSLDDRPRVILGAHYDTRFLADKDPDAGKQDQPVPGANDGGSGVAVLLELARSLPADLDQNVWLVFFDEEDNGNIGGRTWAMGSAYFVSALEKPPDSVVILDMIGDADLNIYFERNSDPQLNAEIWQTASALGYSGQFIALPKYSMIDDHTPFLEAGIRAADLIDFDFPFHHTTGDTLDKVSAESLDAVGEVMLAWLLGISEDGE
jgi:hypothetical protein